MVAADVIEIPTERLLLRLPRLEDATPLGALYSDPEVMSFMGGVRPEAGADPAHIVRQWLERWEANGFGHLVVVRRSDAAFLGRVGLAVWDTRDWRIKTMLEAGEHAQPELGWALARAEWGYGYATEAALAARRWAREELRIDRLISVIAPDNTRSQRVAEKLGCVPDTTVVLPDFDRPAVVWEHPRHRKAA